MNFFRCKNCLMTSLRPRITFNKKGICNACTNYAKYKNINWSKRYEKLKLIANKINIKTKNQKYNCIVPVGGGKDSSYVADKVKNDLGLRPLCVFCEPPLFTKVGKENLNNFKKKGFDIVSMKHCLHYNKFDKLMLIKYGLPQHSWLTAITTFPIKVAIKNNISYIFGGEDAESLYGGSNNNFLNNNIKVSSIISNATENISVRNFYKKKKLQNYKNIYLTAEEKKKSKKIFKIFWSNYEFWDENKHLMYSKKKFNLKYLKKKHSNAINNKSHTDQELYPLHMFLAYLKFGFSRATTDTSIAIREKKITRKQAIKIVKKIDGLFPHEFINKYLNYFSLKKKEFLNILTKNINNEIFINKNLFKLKLKKFE